MHFKLIKGEVVGLRRCVRGLRQSTLDCLTAVLTYLATALVSVQQGAVASMRWMVPGVA